MTTLEWIVLALIAIVFGTCVGLFLWGKVKLNELDKRVTNHRRCSLREIRKSMKVRDRMTNLEKEVAALKAKGT